MEAGPDFSVTCRRAGDAVVVVPVGEIDLATVDSLRTQLNSAVADAKRLVLDLREVTFMDSAGVRLVLESSRALAANGGELVVVRGGAEVRRIFALVGLDTRVPLIDAPPDE